MDVNEHERLFNITLRNTLKHRTACSKKDMDENEDERLSNFTLGHKLNKGTALLLLSTFHSHSKLFNNDQNSYAKMSVKRPQSAVKRYSSFLLIHYIF